MNRDAQWGSGRLVTAAELDAAERRDIRRCLTEPWPFSWTPPGVNLLSEQEAQDANDTEALRAHLSDMLVSREEPSRLARYLAERGHDRRPPAHHTAQAQLYAQGGMVPGYADPRPRDRQRGHRPDLIIHDEVPTEAGSALHQIAERYARDAVERSAVPPVVYNGDTITWTWESAGDGVPVTWTWTDVDGVEHRGEGRVHRAD